MNEVGIVRGVITETIPLFLCSVRLRVRSSPSQGEDIGSNPLPNKAVTRKAS